MLDVNPAVKEPKVISSKISCLVMQGMKRVDFKKEVSTKYQQETHFTYKGKNSLKVVEWRKITSL